jgi:hypothetical protein
MSSTYNPKGTVPQATAPAPVAIASSTNASPIAVTTAAPHGYNNGDNVEITGHDQTAANGFWIISVTGASSFTLAGSTGSGVGTATGQAQDYSVNPTLTSPGDGDLATAASVNVSIQGTANAIPYLNRRVGAFNLHAIYSAADFTSQTNTVSSTALTTSTWVDLTNLTTLLATQGDRYLQAGDILDIRFGTTIELARQIGVLRYAMAIGLVLNGGAASAQSGSVRVIQLDNAISPDDYFPVEISCIVQTGFSPNDRFDISILANKDSAAAYNLALKAGYSLTVSHYRSNA